MKRFLTIFAILIFALGARAETLKVGFGIPSELAVHYGKVDVSKSSTQDNDVAAPFISIGGLDLDSIGEKDDGIEIQFAVNSSIGKPDRLSVGYRLDAGTTLTFKIASARMVLGSGKSKVIKGKITSAEGKNKGATVEGKQLADAYLLKNVSTRNNRAHLILAEFEIPVDASKLAPPASNLPASKKSDRTPTASSKPAKAVAPPVIETDSLKLPRLFCDDMILQQQTSNTFWGWAKSGEEVTVKTSWGTEVKGTADDNGRWKLFVKTPGHGTGHSLTISGKTDTVEIANVAIGEVWLCAGQSNMGFSMGSCFEAEKEADVDLPNFRIFKSAREHWHEPLEMQRDRLSQWKPCDPDSAAETSAVSYYFGKRIHEELGVPVGIIQQAYAGTPIEGWMPWEIQKEDPRAIAVKEENDQSAERQAGSGIASRESGLETWATELAEYNARIDAGDTMKNSVKPWSPPIITKPANLGHQYPGHQFNAMIHPIRPYGIRGAIWYQGERNAKNAPQAFHYRKQLARLITYYRESWHELSGGNVDKGFPFQFTQLPSWTPPQTEPVEGLSAPWAVSREAMRLVTGDVPNTAMAVSIDTGDAVQLHPKNKKPIGLRHAFLALKQTYGKDFVDSGPRFQKQKVEGDQIVLEFDSVGGGLVAAKKGKLDSFAIAGEDRKWHWAKAEFRGNRIAVSSPEVPEPVAVRYAWAMNPSQRNLLYNKEGIPASPFRTDDWPLFDPEAELVEVEKPAKLEEKNAVDWERPVMTQEEGAQADEHAGKRKKDPGKMEEAKADGVAEESATVGDASRTLIPLAANFAPPTEHTYAVPTKRDDGIEVADANTVDLDIDRLLEAVNEIEADNVTCRAKIEAGETIGGNDGAIDSFLLAKDGKLVLEYYFADSRIDKPHFMMSVTKSITSLAIGKAIDEGLIGSEDDFLVDYFPDLDRGNLANGAGTVRLSDLLTMRSGIRVDDSKLDRKEKSGRDYVATALGKSAPIEPGSHYKYQGFDPNLLSYLISEKTEGTMEDFIRAKLFAPMGITQFSFETDPGGATKAAAGMHMRSRDLLKIGQLVMNGGKWNGKQLIGSAWMEKSTDIHVDNGKSKYGCFWWSQYHEGVLVKSARGARGQFIFMIPERNIVAVFTSYGSRKPFELLDTVILPASQ